MFDSLVQAGATAVGMQEDMFRYLIAFLLEVPITLLCRYVPNNPNLKHIIYGSLGLFIAYFVFSSISLAVFVSMIPVYFIMKYMPNRKGAYLSFFITVGYLIFHHIKRMKVNYLGYDLDFSGLQMILTIKFTTFAFSVSNQHDTEYKCSEYTERHKIKQYPTLLEFFGYTFFFPAYFSGPSLEYNDYIAFINMSMFKDFGGKMPGIPKKQTINLVIQLIILITMFFSIAFLNLYEFFESYILKDLDKSGVFVKLTFIMLYVDLAKVKYYFSWKFAELLSVLLGFGYNGKDEKTGEERWDAFKNVDIWKMETSDSIRQIVANWNIQTERWLRYYVYERVAQIPALEKQKSLITNMMSAFWHGLYPGYYIAFAGMTFQQKFQYVLHTQVRPLLTQKYGEKSWQMKLYHTFNYIYTPYAMMYCFAAFVLLSFSTVWTVYSATYFIPHIIAGVVYIWLSNFPIYRRPKKETEKKVEPSVEQEVKKDVNEDVKVEQKEVETTSQSQEEKQTNENEEKPKSE